MQYDVCKQDSKRELFICMCLCLCCYCWLSFNDRTMSRFTITIFCSYANLALARIGLRGCVNFDWNVCQAINQLTAWWNDWSAAIGIEQCLAVCATLRRKLCTHRLSRWRTYQSIWQTIWQWCVYFVVVCNVQLCNCVSWCAWNVRWMSTVVWWFTHSPFGWCCFAWWMWKQRQTTWLALASDRRVDH